MPKLTAKQTLFVQEYLVDFDATQAAKRAGYNAKNAEKIGSELLGKTKVSVAIQQQQAKKEQRTELSVDYVITSLKEVAQRCMQEVPVTNSRGEQVLDDDGKGIWAFNTNGANRSLELLGKHLGAFSEKSDTTGKEDKEVKVTIAIVNGRK